MRAVSLLAFLKERKQKNKVKMKQEKEEKGTKEIFCVVIIFVSIIFLLP